MREAEKDPYLEDKLMVRRWDDLAKDPNMKTLPLNHYEGMAARHLIGQSPWLFREQSLTGADTASYVEVHGRKYRLPKQPTVVVCVDGFDPEYLDHGLATNTLPNLAKFIREGFSATAHCSIGSFTCPNNVCIITGAPTSKHGISGNFWLDKDTREEHMVLDDTLLRGTTILEQMAERGVRIAAVTAKDKLRKILVHGLSPQNGATCFSSEKVTTCTLQEHGIENVESWLGQKAPDMYSGDLSLFVLDAGIKLLEEDRADIFYLTLSDFIQHHYAPESKEAMAFMTAIDDRLGKLAGLGAVVAVTGDHGMSEKTHADGTANILFLEDALNETFGQDFGRVICPITDPFVRHHGALGSYVRVHLKTPQDDLTDVLQFVRSLPQVELALDTRTACERFEMPLDREGDFVVVSTKNSVIGSKADEHDLSSINGHRLRSHGGISEQNIPLIMSVPFQGTRPGHQWRNFDAFDIALNHEGDF
jgi:phosphonoacetate hydrolase